MTATVFSIVLFAAACHAVWNAIVKSAPDTYLTAVLVAMFAGIIGAIALPFLPAPAPESWPFLASGLLLQVIYYVLVGAAYRAADMSLAYPLMRGTAPVIVAVGTALWLGDRLAPTAWAGILLISAGVLATAFGAWRSSSLRGVLLALANAVVIASYTINDGIGVRLSGSPAAYTMWLCVVAAIPLAGRELVTRPAVFRSYVARNAHLGLIGGAGTLVSYGLALWAMTQAPVAVVAALRETAIVFATAIAAFVLRERVTAPRLAAIALIGAGAAVLRLA